jgi:hypothetical protein
VDERSAAKFLALDWALQSLRDISHYLGPPVGKEKGERFSFSGFKLEQSHYKEFQSL